jgi:hypothetical protein
MASIFSAIDRHMKKQYFGQSTEMIGLPPGTFSHADEWVQSRPIPVSGTEVAVVFRGRLDTAMTFSAGYGGICDLKTSDPKAPHIPLYSRQLHAYTLSVEQPAPGAFAMSNVKTLGLLAFQPTLFKQRNEETGNVAAFLCGGLHWIDIERNDDQFMAFLKEVVMVLTDSVPPGGAADCPFCSYLDTARRIRV